MVIKKALVAVAALALAQLAAAAVHPVGGNGAWDTTGNYNAWSATQSFSKDDSLLFTYPSSHDVVEVSKAGYDACSPATAINTYTGGRTTVKLATAGKHYFICGVPGHCAAGMKLQVTVAAAAAKTKPRGQRSVAPASAPAPSSSTDQSSSPAAAAVPSTDSSSPAAAPAAPKSSHAAGIAITGANAAVALAVGMAAALAM